MIELRAVPLQFFSNFTNLLFSYLSTELGTTQLRLLYYFCSYTQFLCYFLIKFLMQLRTFISILSSLYLLNNVYLWSTHAVYAQILSLFLILPFREDFIIHPLGRWRCERFKCFVHKIRDYMDLHLLWIFLEHDLVWTTLL